MRQSVHGWSIVFLVCGLAGCDTDRQGPSRAEVPAAGPAVMVEPGTVEAAPPVPAGQSEIESPRSQPGVVDVEILDWEATRALINQHRGKVVVMDLWATYCPPCVAEFPGLVELSRTHPDRVACISVSCDYLGGDDTPESHRDRVMRFLTKQGATFQNVILSTDAETLFNSKIKQSAIPVVYVFNQQGELAAEFPDQQNPEDFTYHTKVFPLVEQLLKSKAKAD